MAKKAEQKKQRQEVSEVDQHVEKPSAAALNKPPSFHDEISAFALEIESLSRANIQTMKIVMNSVNELAKVLTDFIKERSVTTTTEEGETAYKIKPGDLQLLDKRIKDFRASSLAVNKIPQIFFCALIHQYDAFLGKLLRVAFCVKPEFLNASQKQMTYSELKSFVSLDEACQHIIEKEIESIIREGHAEQFTWMEKRFGLPLRKDLSIWPSFIEMTERRNLFVHCDGVVSSQYLAVCKAHGVKIDKETKRGTVLPVTKEYFESAVDCIMEIGVKLGHVLWRKLQPNHLSAADESLHLISYDLLADEKYKLAKTLLQFATDTLKKHSSDSIRRMNLINLAIVHYYTDKKEEAARILDSQDWSACEDKFKLAVSVLRDNYPEAEKYMKKIGKRGEVTRDAYCSWPLFRAFRKSKEFLRTYKKLFGEDFLVPKKEVEQGLVNNKSSQQNQCTRSLRPG